MVGQDGVPTTGLLTAVRFIKDNRLLPAGFEKRKVEQEIAPQGGAMDGRGFRRWRRHHPVRDSGRAGAEGHSGWKRSSGSSRSRIAGPPISNRTRPPSRSASLAITTRCHPDRRSWSAARQQSRNDAHAPGVSAFTTRRARGALSAVEGQADLAAVREAGHDLPPESIDAPQGCMLRRLLGTSSKTVGQEPLLRMRGVSKQFGGTQALNDAGIDVGEGEIVALLGENGAGKSTLIKILAGVHSLDAGTVTLPRPRRDARIAASPHRVHPSGSWPHRMDDRRRKHLAHARLSAALGLDRLERGAQACRRAPWRWSARTSIPSCVFIT